MAAHAVRRPQLRPMLVLTMAAGLIAAYVARVLAMTNGEILRSDYIIQIVAGDAMRSGLGSHLYDDRVQWIFYHSVAGADHGGLLLFNHAPLAAVIAAPLSVLAAVPGHLVWDVLQSLMLVASCVLVARAAPWPRAVSRWVPAAAVAVALAGAGTLPMLLEGQDLGETALALGAAYWCWRRGRMAWGGAALAAGAVLAKPHLFVGVLLFIAVWRDRRVVLGALAGLAIALVLSLIAVGWGGFVGFVGALTETARSPLPVLGVNGLVAAMLGSAPVGVGVGVASEALTLLAAVVFGAAVRRDGRVLEPALGGALVLSLAASPHLLPHDLVLIAPMLVALLAAAATRDGSQAWPGRRSMNLVALWLVLLAAAGADSVLAIPFRFTPVALAMVAWTCWRECRVQRVDVPTVEAPTGIEPATQGLGNLCSIR